MERLDILRHAASLGAEYVDVERFAFRDLGPVAPTRVIVSQHEFGSMPADLQQRWSAIRTLGADVVKVAGMAADATEILPTLNVLANADVPTIAMAMGAGGLTSRLVTLRYPHCVLSYASLDGDAGTAPGQVSLSTMHDVFRAESIDTSTRIFGLIAPSIEMETVAAYNRLLNARDINAVCVPLQTSLPTLDFLKALMPHGFDGFHVHGPGQQLLARELVEAPDGLNSFSVSAGRLVAGHVASPEDQVDRWLAL
jgi:3-dehydroquinate dehydratase / shikimate dehydrogenase